MELQKENERIKADLIKSKEENARLSEKLQNLEEQKDIQIRKLTQENEITKQQMNEELKKLQIKIHEIEENQRIEDKKQQKSHDSSQNKNIKVIKILDEEDINEIEKLQEIGSGGGGKVFKVATKTIHALKEMNVNNASIADLKHFIGEYEIMNLLNHPNIIKSHGIFMGNEKAAPKILLEFCPKNLDQAIKSKSLSKVQIVICIYQIVEGMKYVHFQKIIHRDLKPSNILIANDGTVKICDFGISKLMSTEEQQTMTIGVGTQKFMAPEIVDESDYNEKVDVYSFGVLAYFVLNDGDISKIKLSDILRGKKPEIPEKFSPFAKELISSCLSFDASERPSFEKILGDIEKNNFNFFELKKSEVNEIKKFVQSFKEKIPTY